MRGARCSEQTDPVRKYSQCDSERTQKGAQTRERKRKTQTDTLGRQRRKGRQIKKRSKSWGEEGRERARSLICVLALALSSSLRHSVLLCKQQ